MVEQLGFDKSFLLKLKKRLNRFHMRLNSLYISQIFINTFSMIESKRNKVKGIKSLEELTEITKTILTTNKFQKITKLSSSIIEAEITYPEVGTIKNLYIHINRRLSKGDKSLEQIQQAIQKRHENGYSKIIIISNDNITNGFQQKLKQYFKSTNLEYWDADVLVEKIEVDYQNFWNHSDQNLLKYEKSYQKNHDDSKVTKNLVGFSNSQKKLIDIFINPRIFLKTKDKQSSKSNFKRQSFHDILNSNIEFSLIEGEAGSGKTRLFKELIFKLIERNKKTKGKRTLPVLLINTDIIESKNGEGSFSIEKALENKLKNYYADHNLGTLTEKYNVSVFIDSIDEFEESVQAKFVDEIKNLLSKRVAIYLGTRLNSLDAIEELKESTGIKSYYIARFNNDQVSQFITRYFIGDTEKAKNLLQSLRENKIIEKLPITPLNLSLLSLLFEENNYEIPATISDIYRNFSNLLLGRAIVDERIKFLDVTLKENILSTYAFKLLSTANNEYLTKDEFVDFFKEEFSSIKGSINFTLLPEALNHLIINTGFLELLDGKYVKFRHSSYMEYFAANEIFKNRREDENLLIENFFNINWQFTAVFYAGFSRRMPKFLSALNKKLKTANTMKDYISGINGAGYILQALYLTDDTKRKDAVLITLEKLIESYEISRKFSNDDRIKVINKLSIPLLAFLSTFTFYDNFNSITLKEPLKNAFDDLLDEFNNLDENNIDYQTNIGFKLFTIALTLMSGRVGDDSKMNILFFETNLINDPFFDLLFNFGLNVIETDSNLLQTFKDEIENRRGKLISAKGAKNFHLKSNPLEYYLKTPSSRLRFSKYDKLKAKKDVVLITEGKTDAIIIEHAFMVLTGQRIPYWEVKPCDFENGGANKLSGVLSNALPLLKSDSTIIGVFDNDDAGIRSFKGNLKSQFIQIDEAENGNCRIKKHSKANIFGILLPIPPSKQNFIRDDQRFNCFAIEHYFPKSYLELKEMIVDFDIPGLYKIKDSKSKKAKFANEIIKENQKEIFKDFIYLFKEIDRLSNKEGEIDYYEPQI